MSSPLLLLAIEPAAMPAWRSLTEALDRMSDTGRRPACRADPQRWAGTASKTQKQAAAEACQQCPAVTLCAAFAEAQDERHGVWGGVDRSNRKKTS